MKDRIRALRDKKMSDKGLHRYAWAVRFNAVGCAVILAVPGRGDINNADFWTFAVVAGLAWSVHQVWWASREKKRRAIK